MNLDLDGMMAEYQRTIATVAARAAQLAGENTFLQSQVNAQQARIAELEGGSQSAKKEVR